MTTAERDDTATRSDDPAPAPPRRRRRLVSRIGVPVASAAALLVVSPAPPASAEVARGIYSSLTACRVAGFAWVALPYFETFECRGFYSAGHGGWRLYIE